MTNYDKLIDAVAAQRIEERSDDYGVHYMTGDFDGWIEITEGYSKAYDVAFAREIEWLLQEAKTND